MALSPGTHGVIVTHGIGGVMKPGEILANFTNYLADYLMESPTKDAQGREIYPEIRREADLSANPPSVALYIKSPGGEEATWLCKEAFWGDAFPPPKASEVSWWLLRQNLKAQITFVWEGVLMDPPNQRTYKFDPLEREKPEWTTGKGLYTKFQIKLSLAGILIPVLAGFSTLILFLIWLVQWIPPFGPLETILRWAHKLDPLLSDLLGDVQRYVEHGVWSANARARMENVIIGMLNDRFGNVQDITIVAHSMGCVVTYDALAEGGKVAAEVARLEAQGKHKKLTFISVGSGINQVFHLARKSKSIFGQRQFRRSLAKEITGYDENVVPDAVALQNKFFWLDIFARRDPAPAGRLDIDIINQAKIDLSSQFKSRRVLNKDSVMVDHTSYWENKDTVIPRIARAINGGTQYPWKEARITAERVAKRTKEAARFNLFTKIAAALIIIGLAAYLGLTVTGVL
jgi:hypothetical protein